TNTDGLFLPNDPIPVAGMATLLDNYDQSKFVGLPTGVLRAEMAVEAYNTRTAPMPWQKSQRLKKRALCPIWVILIPGREKKRKQSCFSKSSALQTAITRNWTMDKSRSIRTCPHLTFKPPCF